MSAIAARPHNAASLNKEWVGQALCFFCAKETSYLLLDKRMQKTFPSTPCIYDFTPCRQCEQYMQKHIILIGIDESSMDRVNREKVEYDSRIESHQRNSFSYQRHRQIRPFVPNPVRTGEWLVVSEDFVQKTFNPPSLVNQILKYRWSFISQDVAKAFLKAHEEFQQQVEKESE